jgi:ABC-type branched-subunit amino acid transport system ATPase component
MLSVEKANIAIEGMPVVRDLSIDIGSGEIVGIVGPNGAGKSSLARAMSGFLKLKSGKILLRAGDSWERIDPLSPWAIARKGIVYVPQERGVFDGLSVADNLMIAFSTLKIGKDRVSSLLNEVYSYFPFLKTRLGQRSDTLSGGEKKMLSIARALLFILADQEINESSRLLILDEPTHGLHHSMRQSLSTVISRIRERGMSVLIVEQIFQFAADLADKCYLMEFGSLKGRLG